MDVNLDRRLTIKRESTSRDPIYGSPEVTWVPLATVWAEVVDEQPSRSETIRSGLVQAPKRSRVRIRYRTDVDASMRLYYGASIMQIVGGPAEIGRKEYLELYVEELTTTGNG